VTHALWIIQGLLALPLSVRRRVSWSAARAAEGPVELPGLLLRFIGVAEVLGAVGLILRRSCAFGRA